jgi:hypothetical protein
MFGGEVSTKIKAWVHDLPSHKNARATSFSFEVGWGGKHFSVRFKKVPLELPKGYGLWAPTLA